MTDTQYTIVRDDQPFVSVSRTLLTDPLVSFKAKGLFALMKSVPEDATFSVSWAMGVSKDGRDAIQSGLAELKKHGYLEREQVRNKGGQIARHLIKLHDNGNILEQTHHNTGNPETGNLYSINNTKNNIPKGESEGKIKKPRKQILTTEIRAALKQGWEKHMGRGTFPSRKLKDLVPIKAKMVCDGEDLVEAKMDAYMNEEKRNQNYRFVSLDRFKMRYHLLAVEDKKLGRLSTDPGTLHSKRPCVNDINRRKHNEKSRRN